MQSMDIYVPPQAITVRRESVPPCLCTRPARRMHTPTRSCELCIGTGRFHECEHCSCESIRGTVFAVERELAAYEPKHTDIATGLPITVSRIVVCHKPECVHAAVTQQLAYAADYAEAAE